MGMIILVSYGAWSLCEESIKERMSELQFIKDIVYLVRNALKGGALPSEVQGSAVSEHGGTL